MASDHQPQAENITPDLEQPMTEENPKIATEIISEGSLDPIVANASELVVEEGQAIPISSILESEVRSEDFVAIAAQNTAAQNLSEPEAIASNHVEALKQEAADLNAEIERLKAAKQKMLESQITDLQMAIARISQASLTELEQRKQELQAAIAVLQKKQDRLQNEMKTTYAGMSQDIAVRVQGFKDYLVGSLQDLVASAEKLELVPPPSKAPEVVIAEKKPQEPPKLAEQSFGEFRQRIEQLLERYRTLPDYYGAAWKLRRTFESTHASRVASWFFDQAGRGAVRTMGTRLQNILVASATVSVLRSLYGEKIRILVLATAPERLGEWRRGFQDCLGLTRDNFGPEKGVVLFEDPEPLAIKGDRLVTEELMPLIIIDEAEEFISVDLLRFPLVIAFGRDPDAKVSYRDRDRDFRDW
jgi:chaperonin cofactor prefoldin